MSTTLARGLPALAAEIAKEHALCEAGYRTALTHAVKVGELLTEAKGQLSHGEWLPWLAKHTPLARNTASTYMQLARAPNDQSSDHLTIGGALRSIAKPTPAPKPSVDLRTAFGRVDQGELDAAMAELDAMPQASRFPDSGMERETWRQIHQALARVERFMGDASRDGLSKWSRREALHEAARHARSTASQLAELAESLAA